MGYPLDESPFALAVRRELQKARGEYCELVNGEPVYSKGHPPQNSAHESYAVLLEEVEEFWEEVRKKREDRDREAMLKELVQIAAMSQRAAEDLGLIPRS